MLTNFVSGTKRFITHSWWSTLHFRYFVSFIVQFQFYEALCKNSSQFDPKNESKPLYLCDFSRGGIDTGSLIR